MTWLCATLQLWCTVCGAVIFWRAFSVIHGLNPYQHPKHYVHFLAFGLGYCLLALAAIGSVVEVWRDQVQMGYVTWLSASALMIVFDRRRRRPVGT